MMEMDGSSIMALASMLQSPGTSKDGNDSYPTARSQTDNVHQPSKITPASLSHQKPVYTRSLLDEKPTARPSKDIWDAEEILEVVDDSAHDPRKRPEYDIRYRQRLSANDLYLPTVMTGKSPSIHDADELVVCINLPEISDIKTVDLQCTQSVVDIRSPIYRLRVPLPENVNDDLGEAKWDAASKQLRITLPIINKN
ncbi:hypothetical protein DFS34DRAFT_348379 [Phlyctochytrium arcticum]|nr:hypothetical protein DFS34DRAFT_348379 [Phlyctochytrium arcticum]